MFKGLTEFIMRGNVVELAVAVVMGVAFGAVVNALVKDFVTPLIAALVGKPDFSSLVFTINGSDFRYGDFLNALIAFLLVAIAVYYFVVAPLNAMSARLRHPTSADAVPAIKACPECLSEIPTEARRCKFCTAVLTV
jgi:large conductance mechanosensitive channel